MKQTIDFGYDRTRIFLGQGIPYATVSLINGGERTLYLSCMTPKTINTYGKTISQRMPCIIWVAGGAWYGGGWRCSEMLPELVSLCEAGFVVIAAQYRVLGEGYFPSQIEDVLTCVRYVKTHAEELHIDPERIGMFGTSAGGHLTLLAANNDGRFDTEAYSSVDSSIKCAAEMYGLSDLLLYHKRCLQVKALGLIPKDRQKPIPGVCTTDGFNQSAMLGFVPTDEPEKTKAASALYSIGDKTCPVLVLHGDKDKLVPHEQSEVYYKRMTELGKDITYYVVKGAGHNTDEFYQPEVKKILLDFFQKKL